MCPHSSESGHCAKACVTPIALQNSYSLDWMFLLFTMDNLLVGGTPPANLEQIGPLYTELSTLGLHLHRSIRPWAHCTMCIGLLSEHRYASDCLELYHLPTKSFYSVGKEIKFQLRKLFLQWQSGLWAFSVVGTLGRGHTQPSAYRADTTICQVNRLQSELNIKGKQKKACLVLHLSAFYPCTNINCKPECISLSMESSLHFQVWAYSQISTS